MEVHKKTTLGNLIIKEVPKILAKELIIEHHYSHKWNDGGFGKFNYGIFRAEEPERCLGVAVYGFMKNPSAKIFTHPNPGAWMCELNRMWIDDCLGHNAESILIAASIKLLRKADPTCVAVQSFADGRLGCGTIYLLRMPLYGIVPQQEVRRNYTRTDIDEYNIPNRLSTYQYSIINR